MLCTLNLQAHLKTQLGVYGLVFEAEGLGWAYQVFSLSVDGQMYSWDLRSGKGQLHNKVNHFKDVTSSAQCMAIYHNMNVAIGCGSSGALVG